MNNYRRFTASTKTLNRITRVSLGAYLLATTSAHAYLDPGTGSMILQAIAAAIISIGVFWRGLVTKIRMMFSRAPSGDGNDARK